MEPILELIRDGSFEPELVTHETATWDQAAEAVAGHDGKLVISREAVSAGLLSSPGSRAEHPDADVVAAAEAAAAQAEPELSKEPRSIVDAVRRRVQPRLHHIARRAALADSTGQVLAPLEAAATCSRTFAGRDRPAFRTPCG